MIAYNLRQHNFTSADLNAASEQQVLLWEAVAEVFDEREAEQLKKQMADARRGSQ